MRQQPEQEHCICSRSEHSTSAKSAHVPCLHPRWQEAGGGGGGGGGDGGGGGGGGEGGVAQQPSHAQPIAATSEHPTSLKVAHVLCRQGRAQAPGGSAPAEASS
jgi:hypothetical protein